LKGFIDMKDDRVKRGELLTQKEYRKRYSKKPRKMRNIPLSKRNPDAIKKTKAYDKRLSQSALPFGNAISDELFMYETASALAMLISYLKQEPDVVLDDALYDMEARMGWDHPPQPTKQI
jgi:hypothetical protein